MFKINNRATGVVLVSSLLTLKYFTPFSSISIVNSEQINAGWEINIFFSSTIYMTTTSLESIN